MTRARDLADYIATDVSDTELDILDGLTTTTAELNYNDTGASVGTVVASKTVTVDANKDASSFRNITMAGDLSIAGDVVTVSNANLDLAPNGTGTVVVKGNDNSGAVVFNCENNSHGQKVYGQPHSAGVTNTLMLPAGANSTLVSLVSTDTLTNKTLTSPKINEDVAVTSTATELNILDGVTATTAELNIMDGVTSTTAELNILDGVTSTTAELNILDGVTSTAAELNILDGVTASATDLNLIDGITNGTVIASKAIITDSNKDITGLRNVTATGAITGGSFVIGSADINENDLESIDGITAGTIAASKAAVVDSNKDVTGFRNITLTGELDAGSLDVSGDADIDGTLEADAITVNGTSLADTITGTTVTNATNAAHVSVADNENTNEENLIPFIEDASATGNVGLESDGDFSYNPSTGTVTATIFKGNIDAVNGDFDGTLETDNLTIGGAQGSDGQVLTSTGSGVGWEAIPASGSTVLIGTSTLSSEASSLTVTGLSSSYDSYRLVYNLITPSSDSVKQFQIRVTNDSGTAYTSSDYFIRSYLSDTGGTTNGQISSFTDSQMQAHTRTDTGNGDIYNTPGTGVMDFFFPKNNTAVFTAMLLNFSRYNLQAYGYKFTIGDLDKDIGGIQFTRTDGGNFAANSFITILAFKK